MQELPPDPSQRWTLIEIVGMTVGFGVPAVIAALVLLTDVPWFDNHWLAAGAIALFGGGFGVAAYFHNRRFDRPLNDWLRERRAMPPDDDPEAIEDGMTIDLTAASPTSPEPPRGRRTIPRS